jgi:nitrite transporter NirC
MEQQSLEATLQLAYKKESLFKASIMRSLMRSALAGMFIGFGVIVAFKTASFFYNAHSPFTYPVAAFTFGVAIVLIAYAGGDLFTGNAFYFSYAALKKRTSWLNVVKLWTSSYIGNMIGTVSFAFLILGSGLFKDESVNKFLLSVVEHKMNAPAMELFFRGILCNWLICLAFFIPMSLKNDGPKLFMMILFVFAFFISGYEHSIANMCSFSIALVIQHPESISMQGALHNLIPVTLGNIVGGAILMGVVYWFLNKETVVDSK